MTDFRNAKKAEIFERYQLTRAKLLSKFGASKDDIEAYLEACNRMATGLSEEYKKRVLAYSSRYPEIALEEFFPGLYKP